MTKKSFIDATDLLASENDFNEMIITLKSGKQYTASKSDASAYYGDSQCADDDYDLDAFYIYGGEFILCIDIDSIESVKVV